MLIGLLEAESLNSDSGVQVLLLSYLVGQVCCWDELFVAEGDVLIATASTEIEAAKAEAMNGPRVEKEYYPGVETINKTM
jgi:hypothetical protein